MKPFVVVGLLLLMLNLLCAQGEWEMVYREQAYTIDELPFLSIAVSGKEAIIGSITGHLIADLAEMRWQGSADLFRGGGTVVQIDPPFDVTAIAETGEGWIIGGPEGQIATHGPIRYSITVEPPTDEKPPVVEFLDPFEEIATGWTASRLPTRGTVSRLVGIEDHIIAQIDDTVYSSTDGGASWRPITSLSGTFSIIKFKQQFYCLQQPHEEGSAGATSLIRLLKSDDGLHWDTVWEFTPHPNAHWYPFHKGQLMVLSGYFDQFGAGQEDTERLFCYYEHSYYPTFNSYREYTATFSSVDGENWRDHGSVIFNAYASINSNSYKPWNPLSLPIEDRYFSPVNLIGEKSSGNYSINGPPGLRKYTFYEWESIISSNQSLYRYPFQPALWDQISFPENRLNPMSILTLDTKGILTSHPFPDFDLEVEAVEDWNVHKGVHYGVFKFSDDTRKFLASDNLLNWTELPLPDGARSVDLMTTSPIITVSLGYYVDREFSQKLVHFQDQWSDFIELPGETVDVAYLPASKQWYTLWRNGPSDGNLPDDERTVNINSINADGAIVPFAEFLSESWNGYFNKLSCPDGQTLVAHGSSAELGIIHENGFVQLAHPWKFFPEDNYKIDKVRFINGWYYLLGSVSLRTRDFVEFEEFLGPYQTIVKDVYALGDQLYIFLDGTAYRKSMNLGYLDSIIREQGWYHSDWLGWFQIIDEDLGDIDHLLLGETRVKQEKDQQYWLRTSTLGWIYMRSDWSPWFWRMEDGHWYLLDQESWPPRAWDYDDQVWEELEP